MRVAFGVDEENETSAEEVSEHLGDLS